MRLIYEKSRADVCIGDIVTMRDGSLCQVESIEKPRHGGSTGRVYVRELQHGVATGPEHGYFPSVICAVWVDRDDQ